MRNIIQKKSFQINDNNSKENELNIFVFHYSENYKFEHIKLNHHNVIFILKGNIQIYNQERTNKNITPFQFFLATKQSVIKGCVEKGSELLVVQFGHIFHEEMKIKMQNLRNKTKHMPYTFRALIANNQINLYIQQLNDLVKLKASCQHYAKSKVNELFHILEHYYTIEDYFTFSYPLLSHATSFKEMILQNYLKTNNLKELQESTGMSASTFNRKFKAEFNDSAYQWLLKQKASQIRIRLMNESTTLADIIREFRFHSHSHLQKYCKAHFNMNPSELKKVLRSSK